MRRCEQQMHTPCVAITVANGKHFPVFSSVPDPVLWHQAPTPTVQRAVPPVQALWFRPFLIVAQTTTLSPSWIPLNTYVLYFMSMILRAMYFILLYSPNPSPCPSPSPNPTSTPAFTQTLIRFLHQGATYQ